MANTLFDPGRAGFLTGAIDADTAVIKAALLRNYVFNASHTFVSEVTGVGGVLVVTSGALTSVTTAAGVFDAADIVYPAVAPGPAVTAVLLFQASAVTGGVDAAATAQRLIGIVDSAGGLPVTPNGGDITVSWDNGPNKIFKL